MIEVPIQDYETTRMITQKALEKNRELVSSFPRYIREALYMYTKEEVDEDVKRAINDAFNAIPPIEKDITVFRGIQSTRKDISLKFSDFMSTSASVEVAKDFRGESSCCLFVVNVPIGSKVLYIPKDIHYEDDDEQEVLLQGGGELHVESEILEGEFKVNYVVPFATKFNISRMASIKNKMETIGHLNSVALRLGAEKGKVIEDGLNEFIDYLEAHEEIARKFYDVIIEELTPYPLEIQERPVAKSSAAEMFLTGESRKYEWDIPKGVPFSRICIYLLFIIINLYPKFTPVITHNSDPYKFIKSFCDHLKLSSSFVFGHIGAIDKRNHSYRIALEFDVPEYTDSEYVKKFIDILISDRDDDTKDRRKTLLHSIRPYAGIVLKRRIDKALEA